MCQLRCPSCPTHSGAERPAVGTGFLKLPDFQDLIRKNPWVREVELSNYGEIFLNPDLLGILEYAHERGIALRADNGVNFNRVSDEVLDGLVKYKLRSMTCSIDGASEQTYRLYRVNGSLSTVIENIRKLNALKSKYRSESPALVWQFVVFGHNEQEISQARELARVLDMTFYPKLSWDPQLAPVLDKELVRMEVGAADREEYKQRFGVDYGRACCLSLWNRPQINWDGRVLGCSRNFWSDFGTNAFTDGLATSVNGPGMRYAKQMLLGKKPAKDGIPCTTCSIYLDMRAEGKWLKKSEIRAERRPARTWPSARVRRSVAWRGARYVYRSFRPIPESTPNLASRVYSLTIPLPPDEERGSR